jgi:hypothetical protein
MHSQFFERRPHRNVEAQVFDSVQELIDSGSQDMGLAKRFGASQWDKFIGRAFRDWDNFREVAAAQWGEGLSLLESAADRVRDVAPSAPVTRRRRPHYSEDRGDEVDLDRLRSGKPFLRSTRRENAHGPTSITLAIDITTPAGRKPEEIVFRGVAGIVAAEILERNGYRVAIWAHNYTNPTYTDGVSGLQMLCLKRLGDPIDSSSLVSAVSGWMYRTAWFGVIRRPPSGRQATEGLGPCARAPRELVAELTQDEDVFFIEDCFDLPSACLTIRQILDKTRETH